MRRLPCSLACLALLLALPGACSVETGSSRSAGAASASKDHAGWFEGSFDDGLEQARASSKLAFVDLWTSWCGPCKRLEQVTFPDPAVQAELAKFVALSIDAESPAGEPLMARYKIAGYPTMLVVAPDGREVGRIVGFKEPAVLVRLLEEIRTRETR